MASQQVCARRVSSSFRLGRRNGLKNVVEPTVLQRNGETAAAISLDIAEQDLRLVLSTSAVWWAKAPLRRAHRLSTG
jgi:hypothetical protein